MVVIALPERIADFEGTVSHTAMLENDTLMFIKAGDWISELGRINDKIKELPSMQRIDCVTQVHPGEVYLVSTNGIFERAYIIRRSSAQTFLAYLLDQGVLNDLNYFALYEFPQELLQFEVFSCIVPVVMPFTERLSLYNALRGSKCKCTVESVSPSRLTMGHVRGEVLVEHKGKYEDLRLNLRRKARERMANRFFKQTAYKQYEPQSIPTVLNVTFDKKDRGVDTFWVVNRENFEAVEQELRNCGRRIMTLPRLQQSLPDFQLRQIPCVVRTRLNCSSGSLFRGVPAKFDTYTRRYSIFLVDYGWFTWIRTHDIIDVTYMDKSDPIRELPVSLIHCRQSNACPVDFENLVGGKICKIQIKDPPQKDVYKVEVLEVFPPFSYRRNQRDGKHEPPNAIRARSPESDGNKMQQQNPASTENSISDMCLDQIKDSVLKDASSTNVARPRFQCSTVMMVPCFSKRASVAVSNTIVQSTSAENSVVVLDRTSTRISTSRNPNRDRGSSTDTRFHNVGAQKTNVQRGGMKRSGNTPQKRATSRRSDGNADSSSQDESSHNTLYTSSD